MEKMHKLDVRGAKWRGSESVEGILLQTAPKGLLEEFPWSDVTKAGTDAELPFTGNSQT